VCLLIVPFLERIDFYVWTVFVFIVDLFYIGVSHAYDYVGLWFYTFTYNIANLSISAGFGSNSDIN
jgi:hypothetical protein